MQAVHRQHNTAADAAGLSPRGGCRAACAQLPDSEGPGASTSRVADRGWCFGTVAWFKSLCVWAALAGLGSPHWHLAWRRRWCGDCGLVARSGRRVLRRLSPVASLWGWVRVRCNPMACPGAAWVGLPRVRWWRLGGWGLVGRVMGPSSRAAGNCETCTPGQCQWHAAARCHSSLTQQASGLFVASSVARKPILPL